MAITTTTLVATCTSLSTARHTDGNTYTLANCEVACSTGTVKTGLDGQYNDSGGVATFVNKSTIVLAFKSGAGTAPAVGETFNVVLG